MADNLSIIIQALIEKASTEAIKSQIDELQKYADTKKINFKLDIDNTQFKTFANNIDKIAKSTTTTLNVDIDPSIKQLNKVQEKWVGATAKSRDHVESVHEGINATGQLVKITDQLDTETDTVRRTTALITENLDQARKEQEKLTEAMARGREKSQERVKKDNVQAELAQAKAINKAKDDNYKLQQKQTAEQEKQIQNLDLYKQKMLGGDGFSGDLDIFASKQKGRFESADLEKLRSQIKALNVDTPNLQQNIKKLDIQFSSLKQSAAQSGSVMSRAFENAYKFLRFYLVGGILVRFINTFKDGINVIVDLDSSLTELNKVADVTSAKLEEVTDRAFNMGATIGRTGKEVIDATSEWVRAGYGVDEAMGLAEQSLLLTNIGDGINDVKEASSSLISILKGFKLEAYDASHAVDALNQVSNTFAVATNNLTEILKRTSGAIGQTGTSYEELLGLATGGFETLRSAEMVASGINMISQRKTFNSNAKLLEVASYAQKCA